MNYEWFGSIVDWWTTDRVRTAATCVAAAAAVVAAFVGSRSFAQTRRDSKARSRPMVAAELRDNPHAQGSQQLVIMNCGPSIAKHVRVTFDPEISDPAPGESDGLAKFIKERYAKPISTMTPGAELDNIYFSGERNGSTWVNREPTPEQVTVTITYESTNGDAYTDHYELDTDLIRGRTYVMYSAAPEARLKEAVRNLSRIESALAEIAKNTSPPPD